MPRTSFLAQQKDARLVVRWQSELLETLEVDEARHQQDITVQTTALPLEAASDCSRAIQFSILCW
jgi:hypothetical protein